MYLSLKQCIVFNYTPVAALIVINYNTGNYYCWSMYGSPHKNKYAGEGITMTILPGILDRVLGFEVLNRSCFRNNIIQRYFKILKDQHSLISCWLLIHSWILIVISHVQLDTLGAYQVFIKILRMLESL